MVLSRLVRACADHPVACLVLVGAATAGLLVAGPSPETADVEELFAPEDLPEREAQAALDESFGRSTPALVLFDDGDPTGVDTVRAQARLLAALDPAPDGAAGLAPAVQARTDTPIAEMTDDELRDRIDELPTQAPPLSGLVGEDATVLALGYGTDDDAAVVAAVDAGLEDAREGYPGTVEASGPAHLAQAQQDTGTRDVQVLVPLAVGAILVVLYAVFRRGRDVLAAAGTATLATGWAYLLLPWLGVPFSPLLFSVAPLLLGLGVDYVVHVAHAYRDATGPDRDVPGALAEAFGEVGPPVAYTALTTGVGFAAFLASPIPQIRHWGSLLIAAVVGALLLAVTVLPALYGLLDGRSGRGPDSRASLGAGVLDRVAAGTTDRPAWIGGLVLATCLLAAGFAATVTVDTDVGSSADDSPAAATLDRIEAAIGPQTRATVLVEAPAGDVREELDELTRELAATEGVASLDSPTARARAANNGSLPGPEAFQRLVATTPVGELTADGRTRVDVRYGEGALGDLQATVDASPLDATLTGPGPLQEATRGLLLENLVTSTGLALAGVALALAAIQRSPRWWALAALPLPVVVLWQFGAMGALGIPLNPVTGVTSAMVLGVGVDYALHLTHRLRAEVERGAPRGAAARRSVRAVGRPVLAATATTVAAFTLLGISANPQVRQFGRVAAIAILAAFAVTVVGIPLVGARIAPETEVGDGRSGWWMVRVACSGCGARRAAASTAAPHGSRAGIVCGACGEATPLAAAGDPERVEPGPDPARVDADACSSCGTRWTAGGAGSRLDRCPACGDRPQGTATHGTKG